MSDNINVEVKRKNPSIPPKNLRQLTAQVAEIEGTIDDINESVEEAEQDVHEIKTAIDNSNDFTIRNGKMVRKNKRYAPAQYSGLGEIYLEKNETFLGREFNEFVTNVTVPDPTAIAETFEGLVYDRHRKEFLAYELVDGERVYYAEWIKFDKWESTDDYIPEAGYDFICEDDNKAYRWTEEATPDLIETEAHYGNVLKQEMVIFSNTIYHIQYDYDLIGKGITIPERCVLQFEGGSLINGTITGNNTSIEAGLVKIFNTDITLTCSWNVAEAYSEWFGAKGDGTTDDRVAIQKVFGTWAFNNIKFQKKTYLINSLSDSENLIALSLGEARTITGVNANRELGRGTVIKFGDDLSANIGLMISGRFITIKNITLSGTNIDNTISTKYDGSYTPYLYLDKVCIIGGKENGYNINTYICNIKNCTAESCKVGFNVDALSTSTSSLFENCYCISCAEHSYNINNLYYSTFLMCFADHCGKSNTSSYTFRIRNSHNISLLGCASEDAGKTIAIFNSSNIVALNCRFQSNDEWKQRADITGYVMIYDNNKYCKFINCVLWTHQTNNRMNVSSYDTTFLNCSYISLDGLKDVSYLSNDKSVKFGSSVFEKTPVLFDYEQGDSLTKNMLFLRDSNLCYEDKNNVLKTTFSFSSNKRIGTTSERPSLLASDVGMTYYDETINIPLFWNGKTYIKYDGSFPEQDAIDLGLPSGTLWRNRNIGAEAPKNSGSYFTWGNTNEHVWGEGDDLSSSAYAETTGAAISANIIAGSTNDAARVVLGAPWVMPSSSQIQELFNNCTVTTEVIDGSTCAKLTSNINGNYIYFPLSGYWSGTTRSEIGSVAIMWTTTYRDASTCIRGTLTSKQVSYSNRYFGLVIRPVIKY